MTQQLARDVRFLKRYAIVSTTVFAVATLAAFARPMHREKFTEIDVERINVMEPDGKYRMVISNRPRSIGPIYKGKPFGYEGGGRPGIIFFNDDGTENGGLTFAGTRGPDGTIDASTHMSFDQFNQDQVLNLDYSDRNGRRRVGISMLDRAQTDIYDLVAERDSIRKIADPSVATPTKPRHFSYPILEAGRGSGLQLIQRGCPVSCFWTGRDESHPGCRRPANECRDERSRTVAVGNE